MARKHGDDIFARLRRLALILRAIRAGRCVGNPELRSAVAAGGQVVTSKTVERDIGVLRDLGAKIVYSQSERGYILKSRGFSLSRAMGRIVSR